jgi:hypothetical protein
MRERDPDGLAINEELDIDGVGVAGGDGDDKGLIEAVDVAFGPAIGGVEVVEHGGRKMIAECGAVGKWEDDSMIASSAEAEGCGTHSLEGHENSHVCELCLVDTANGIHPLR